MPCRFPLCPGPTSFSNCSLQRSPLFLDNVHRRGVLPTVLQVKLVSWQSTEPAFPPGQDLCSLALKLRVRTDLSQSNTPLSDWALQEGQWQPWASHPTPPAWELCPLRSCRCRSAQPAAPGAQLLAEWWGPSRGGTHSPHGCAPLGHMGHSCPSCGETSLGAEGTGVTPLLAQACLE